MASSSDGKLHLASMHLLAVVEIRPPGVQILLFLSTTKVTTELQTEGFFFSYVPERPERGLAAHNGKRLTAFLGDALSSINLIKQQEICYMKKPIYVVLAKVCHKY